MLDKLKTLLGLHLLLMVYSCSGIFSKFAAGYSFLSFEFLAFYAGVIALLGVYALGWQQVLKRMDLTAAYANRAVAIIWGIIWGLVFFAEPITAPKVVGALFIMAGVVLFAIADNKPKAATSAEEQGGDIS